MEARVAGLSNGCIVIKWTNVIHLLKIKTANSASTGGLINMTRPFSTIFTDGPGYEATLFLGCRKVCIPIRNIKIANELHCMGS